MSDPSLEPKNLKEKVDEMAHAIADTVIGGQHVDKQDLDAFRMLCQYLGVKFKIGSSEDPEPQGGSFEQWSGDTNAEVSNGK